MPILKVVRTLLGVAIVTVGVPIAYAQTSTTEILNFDNNLLPNGWSMNSGSAGPPDQNNGLAVIQNQRLEIDNGGSWSTAVWLNKTLSAPDAAQIRVEYDSIIVHPSVPSQIPNQFRDVSLYNDSINGGLSAYGGIFAYCNGSDPSCSSLTNYPMILVGGSVTSVPLTYGVFHSSMIVNNGSLRQIITFGDSGVTFDSGVVDNPGFLLSNVNTISFNLESPPGEVTWMDNVTITTVTAVPEPETYAMLLAGLGVIGAVAGRREARTRNSVR